MHLGKQPSISLLNYARATKGSCGSKPVLRVERKPSQLYPQHLPKLSRCEFGSSVPGADILQDDFNFASSGQRAETSTAAA